MTTTSYRTQSGCVTKTACYTTVVFAFLLGILIGFSFSSLLSEETNITRKQIIAPSSMPADNQINQETLAHILELEQKLIADSTNVNDWIHLGHLYFDTDQSKAAIRAYTRALELTPHNPDVLTDLGVMYRAEHLHQEALDAFEKALQLNPKHEIAQFNKGIVLYFDMKNVQEGIAAWKKLVELNPQAKAPNGTLVTEMIRELSAN